MSSGGPNCGARDMASTAQPGRRDLKPCPRCGTMMFIARTLEQFRPVPGTRRYCCPECRCVVEKETGRAEHPLAARKFNAWLSGWGPVA